MTHLEALIAEYLEWEGFLVKSNIRVGKLDHGGWAMELDVVGYNPETGALVHYEPSVDGDKWKVREARYTKKFDAGRRYIQTDIFPWLPIETRLDQIAVLVTHPKGRDTIAGGRIQSIDELVAEITTKVTASGPLQSNAIPEQFSLLRTIQLTHVGYVRIVQQ
jgi:hypothetical protein